jgi:hypothetical protein
VDGKFHYKLMNKSRRKILIDIDGFFLQENEKTPEKVSFIVDGKIVTA